MEAHAESEGRWWPCESQQSILAFDPINVLHAELADAARRAEALAPTVTLPPDAYFTTKRGIIRDALTASGIAAGIGALVLRLLPE